VSEWELEVKMKDDSMNSDITFEESIIRLEGILKQLEKDKIDLSTALSQYEEGVRLIKNCHSILESAQQKIEMLRGNGE